MANNSLANARYNTPKTIVANPPLHPDMETRYADLGYIQSYARLIGEWLAEDPTHCLHDLGAGHVRAAHDAMVVAYTSMLHTHRK